MSDKASARSALLNQFKINFDLDDLPDEKLDLALTHSSHAYERGMARNNERLEFLGDAVIGLIAADYLFHDDTGAVEGVLTKRRARLVSRALLGRRGEDMGIGPLLLLGHGEAAGGGRAKRSVLGSALESITGAVFGHRGYEGTALFVRRHIVEPLMGKLRDDTLHGDYKSGLQEWSQSKRDCVPTYRVVEESGPAHARQFRVEVQIDGEIMAEASGNRIQRAQNEAARIALEKIRGSGDDSGDDADSGPGNAMEGETGDAPSDQSSS